MLTEDGCSDKDSEILEDECIVDVDEKTVEPGAGSAFQFDLDQAR